MTVQSHFSNHSRESSIKACIAAFLAVVASHWIEFLLLKTTQPSRMFALVYHRMRKSAKGLHLLIRETDTPLEFSEVLTAHLAKLGSSGLLSEVLHTAPQAAAMILDGVRNDQWRILIGTDTISLDDLVRRSPETAYDPDFVERWREANRQLVEDAPD